MYSITENEIHLPDLVFVQLCEEKYNINRGVYNTIDNWLNLKGIKHIIDRRVAIVDFFEYVTTYYLNTNKSGKLKFGNGGLTDKLENFWINQYGHTQ
ncbi:hypothetical protein [Priestia megaterium]|uniref:hypothetical protein n=1 Tax=Priestia megaterium TaxID=1404 RepID=UPI003A7FCB21